jgi:V/A-type H+-transporting ATPase subunit D
MKIRVSATRMELLKLKKRLALAVRGHHLLKDKQDELVRQFFVRQERYRRHLDGLWPALEKARLSLEFLGSVHSEASISLACRSASDAPPLVVHPTRILNITVPEYGWAHGRLDPLYGFLDGAGLVENVLGAYIDLLPQLIGKASLEKAMTSLLDEIEVTKRRVNALEYNLIPSLRESIRGITAKLGELELSNLTRLMRVKEIISQAADMTEGKAAHGDDLPPV